VSDSIYLDYAATSPVDPRIADVMDACLRSPDGFANPSSDHRAGKAATVLLRQAEARIRKRIGADRGRLVFTSGATEANNLALEGFWRALPVERRHIVSSRIEHRSVLDTLDALQGQGATVTLVDCNRYGVVDPDEVLRAIRPDTGLVSIMHVNNEIGSIQPIDRIANVCNDRDIPLHTDAAQSAGKIELDVEGSGLALCSLNAHKINGPKGVGALYIRDGLRLMPLMHGGDQQGGLRPGTLATHQIVGLGLALELADPAVEGPQLTALREHLWARLSEIPDVIRAGEPATSAPHILNVSFAGVEGESLRLALEHIDVSSGSACSADRPEPSYVLTGLGLSDARAQSSLRFGVGRFTTEAELERAAIDIDAALARLRSIAGQTPDWCRA
jgi:cysteine desulfurase